MMVERYPQHRFQWIVGADMAIDFPNWQSADEILQYVTLLALARPGHHLDRWVSSLPPSSPLYGKIRVVPMLQVDISSSDIRRRVKSGLGIAYLTPAKVADYIKEKRLYED
jgi:nicotinate-nucleotide adenylyltransferase